MMKENKMNKVMNSVLSFLCAGLMSFTPAYATGEFQESKVQETPNARALRRAKIFDYKQVSNNARAQKRVDVLSKHIQRNMDDDASCVALAIDGAGKAARIKLEEKKQALHTTQDMQEAKKDSVNISTSNKDISASLQPKLTPRNAGITAAILAVLGASAYAAKTVSSDKAKVKLSGLASRFKKSFARAA